MDNTETQHHAPRITIHMHRWFDLYGSIMFAMLACCTLVMLSMVAETLFKPMYLLQIGLPIIAAWLSVGVVIDDKALEMILATKTPMRRLWLVRALPVVAITIVVSVVWLWYLDQPRSILMYTVLLIIGASGWAQALTYWRASSLVGRIGVTSVLLSQYVAPALWLPMLQFGNTDYGGAIKSLFFFPLDADPMFVILQQQRSINAFVIGGLGCLSWIWCFTRYNNLEHFLTADRL